MVWGAGRAAANRLEWAALAGCRVRCFADNDPEKWGKKIEGVAVCPPKSIKDCKCRILIPDLYGEEIGAQLEEMGCQGRKVCFSAFKKEAVCRKEATYSLPEPEPGRQTCFVFDAYFPGFNWGGVESWSCTVANQLADMGVETHVACGANKKFDEYTKNCLHFQEETETGLIRKMAAAIAERLPCIFLTHGSIALYAARLVKAKHPDEIQLVAVAHGDERNTYENLQSWSGELDKIICISRRIQEKFLIQYKVGKDKLVYRMNPIRIPDATDGRSRRMGSLKVGFSARLRKEQKRTHLLPELIDLCLERGLDIIFSIAGEGECLELLERYVSDRHLEGRVRLFGWIPPVRMAEFWGEQDVYLNLSDFEGMSLAMLEAMACGAVPVVTLVSGVEDLVEDGENGFVVAVDRWREAADKLELLCRDRTLLERAGGYNRNLVRAKCDVSDYARWLRDTFYS